MRDVELSASESDEIEFSDYDKDATDISVFRSVSRPAASASADSYAESYCDSCSDKFVDQTV